MVRRTIAHRDLRNDLAWVLREAEAGTTFTITVRGEPMAQLGPLTPAATARVDVERSMVREILATPVDSEAWQTDVDAAEAPADDPWHDS